MEAPKLIKSIDELAVAKAEQKCPKSSEAFNHLVKYYTISLREEAENRIVRQENDVILDAKFREVVKAQGEMIGLDIAIELAEPFMNEDGRTVKYIVIEKQYCLRFYGGFSDTGFIDQYYPSIEEQIAIFELI